MRRAIEEGAKLWLGNEEGQWVIHVFALPSHAVSWLNDDRSVAGKRHIWKVRLVDVQEHVLTPPVEQQLVPYEEDA